MSDQNPSSDGPHYWSQSAPSARWRRAYDTPLRRFIGGSPLAVLVKLIVISFIVGALLMWLHISPSDVLFQLQDIAHQLWLFGFRSLSDFGNYLVAGAAIVIPVWLVVRLMSYRGR